MNHYLILHNKEIYFAKEGNKKRGYTFNEANDVITKSQWIDAQLINIDEDLNKENIQLNGMVGLFDDEASNKYFNWYSRWLDNNINGFLLPIQIETNNEYQCKLRSVLMDYYNAINTVAFKYEFNLVNDIKTICQSINDIVELALNGKQLLAERSISSLINNYIGDDFWVSELDKSYAFRGIAPFYELHSEENENTYRTMLEGNVTFYRGRTKKNISEEKIEDLEHMVHLPYEMKERASKMRFSVSGQPCLYLGTTSFVCSEECRYNEENEKFYASAFVPNEKGKKLKILNMVISEPLINGIYNKNIEQQDLIKRNLQNSMLRLFPLVIATSFRINDKQRSEKYEYIVSQLLMRVINKLGIDGIAYFSKQGENDFQYPHGINIALPCTDINQSKQYSEYCKAFRITKPFLLNPTMQLNNSFRERSYINKNYPQYDKYEMEEYMSKVIYKSENVFYGDTIYSKFDDFLLNQEMFDFMLK